MKQVFILFSFLIIPFLSKAQSLPIEGHLPFKILDTRTGEQISITQAADRIGRADVLFWGEEHNDTIGHVLELKMLKLLNERYNGKLMLSLEMFETDCQVLVDEYLGGFVTREKFLKDSRPWNNYEQDYSPMVEFAKEQKIPVIAANSPRRLNNLMSKRGPKSLDSLGPGSKRLIAKLPVYVPKKGKYYKKFVGIMGGENNIHSPNMFASQCLWDATMAKSIDNAVSENKKNGLVFHVCGRFHCDEYLGTVAQLLRKDNDLEVATISCFPAEDFEKPDFKQYAELADFVILTQRIGQ